jgi:pyruvate dehydrogenase (quinone)
MGIEIPVPPKITFKNIKNISLYSLKAIINGKGNEIYELISRSLWK